MENIDTVVIIEELMPYLEDAITGIAKNTNSNVKILGKHSDAFSMVGEYNTAIVTNALAKIIGIEPPINYKAILDRAETLKSILPKRLPTFCPGCPHRGTIWSVLQALKGIDYVVNNVIGCYSMLLLEPYEVTDSARASG